MQKPAHTPGLIDLNWSGWKFWMQFMKIFRCLNTRARGSYETHEVAVAFGSFVLHRLVEPKTYFSFHVLLIICRLHFDCRRQSASSSYCSELRPLSVKDNWQDAAYFSALFTIQSSSRLIDCRFLLSFFDWKANSWMTPGFLSFGDFDDRCRSQKVFPPTRQAFPLLKTFLDAFPLAEGKLGSLSSCSLTETARHTCVWEAAGCSFDPLPRRIGQPRKLFALALKPFTSKWCKLRGIPDVSLLQLENFFGDAWNLKECSLSCAPSPGSNGTATHFVRRRRNLYPQWVGVYFIWLGTWSHGEHFNVLCSIHTKML